MLVTGQGREGGGGGEDKSDGGWCTCQCNPAVLSIIKSNGGMPA